MRIYITFDYEMYLGPEVGSVERCLIEPTKRLCHIASKHRAHFVFFVDVLFLIKMRDYITKSPIIKGSYDAIVEQLKTLHSLGHDLQLHLHPQWFYSQYDLEANKWMMDYNHYKLDDCPLCDIKQIINEGIGFLQTIIGQSPKAYRAGGYCFPNDNDTIRLLADSGIIIDSSVLPNEKNDHGTQSYNYTDVQNCKPYFFSTDIHVPQCNGLILEFPIFNFAISHLKRYFINKILERVHGDDLVLWGDGKGIGCMQKEKRNLDIFGKVMMRASVDSTNAHWLSSSYTKARKQSVENLVIIGHPKRQSNYSLKCLDNFLANINNNDQIHVFSE